MGFFDIEYELLQQQLLPVRLRKLKLKAWIKCLMAPVVWLYGKYMANRAANLYDLAHNGQVCYLEAVLNDAFDSDARGIYITDNVYHDPVYIFRRTEDKPVFIYRRSEMETPAWLYRRSEVTEYAPGFIINIPGTVTYDLARLRALADKYKLTSKQYIINNL